LCAAGEIRTNGSCVKPSGTPTNVRVSTVGFVPGTSKQATYAGPASTFVIRSADDDSVVFPDVPGAVGPAVNATDTGEPETHTVDFSDLDAPGEYYIDVDGVGRSVTFRIGDDVFVEPFQATMLGMYGMRCGAEVSLDWHGTTFGHKACHLADGPAKGGWHDAGDYGKYTNNGAFSLGMMLAAWDHFRSKLEGVTLPIPEQDNGIPDYLDECIYQANWLVGMQLDDGSVSDRITAANFDGLSVMPEGSNLPRMMAPASSKATGDAAAALAHLARIVREFDADLAATYEDSATRAWQFLVDNPAAIPPPKSGFTGSYGLGNNPDSDNDDRAWAAAEIFETTGDMGALAAFEDAGNGLSVQGYWDWDDVSNLGVFTYLTSTRDGRSQKVLDHLTASLKVTANSLVGNALGTSTTPAHAYGRSLANTYNWGINGTIARTTLALVVASKLVPENARVDLDAASLQLDHLFGRNYYGRSFVTGVGGGPPMHPHHRPSVADGIDPPWPGLLVGGSWAQSTMGQTPPPAADSWIDDSNNYQTNEVAINWNAPLIYLLAAFLPEP
jgi:endoglucanase